MEKCLVSYAAHHYRYRQQYSAIRHAKDGLRDEDILLHVDFSENYTGKRGQEIQAMHFGNRRQVTIHQGILYCKVNSNHPLVFADTTGLSVDTINFLLKITI
jgi:hypothetical protein